MAHQLEATVIEQMLDITPRAGEKIIDAQDLGTIGKQPLAQMRPQKPRAASNQYSTL